MILSALLNQCCFMLEIELKPPLQELPTNWSISLLLYLPFVFYSQRSTYVDNKTNAYYIVEVLWVIQSSLSLMCKKSIEVYGLQWICLLKCFKGFTDPQSTGMTLVIHLKPTLLMLLIKVMNFNQISYYLF